MDLQLYSFFILSCIALALIPGPGVAAIVASTLAHGTRYGLCIVTGSLIAMAIQMIIVTAGLSVFIIFVTRWFEVLRWAGVCYLLYLGIKYWRSIPQNFIDSGSEKKQTVGAAYRRGFVTAATSPKILLFLGAFFPQFIKPENDIFLQMLILSLTFLAIIGVFDSFWAFLAGAARPFLAKTAHITNKISAAFFFMAGFILALIRQ